MSDTLQLAVQGLLDREAIRHLPIIYCHYVRTKNIDAIIDLYAPDCVFDVPLVMAEGGLRAGRDAIRQTFNDNLERMDPWPFTHNHVVELIDAAHARGYVYTEFRIGSDRLRLGFVGCYHDHYVKIADTWKFASRQLTSIPVDGDHLS